MEHGDAVGAVVGLHGARPLEPNTGDSRSLACVMCPAVTPDSDYCCGLPYCLNCLPIHDCQMDNEGPEDGI